MNISIVIPTINSSKIIKKTVEHTDNYLKDAKFIQNYEIIISAQDSDDNTFEVIKKLASNTIKPVFSKIRGKGIGLNKGIKATKHDWICMIDDDLSYPIDFLDDAHKHIDYDIIIGSRYMKKQDLPFIRKLASKMYHLIVGVLFHLRVKDVQSGLKLFNKKVINKKSMLPKSIGFVWDTEFLYLARKNMLKVLEIPIDYDYHSNQLKVSRAAPRMLKDLIKLYLRLH